MGLAADSKRQKQLREDFLVVLWELHAGNYGGAQSTKEVCKRIGVEYDTVGSFIGQHLRGEDLVTWSSFEWISLTPKGRREAERIVESQGEAEALSDRHFMLRAIERAHECISEPGRISPKVGAIIVRNGVMLGEAYRGELNAGEHAEFTLLEKKLSSATVAGGILFTTLEPCTVRNFPKIDCASRIIERRLAKVFIGTLDPDPRIHGAGELQLRGAGVQIARFDPDLMSEIEELNRDFIRQYRSNNKQTSNASETYITPQSYGAIPLNRMSLSMYIGSSRLVKQIDKTMADANDVPLERWDASADLLLDRYLEKARFLGIKTVKEIDESLKACSDQAVQMAYYFRVQQEMHAGYCLDRMFDVLAAKRGEKCLVAMYSTAKLESGGESWARDVWEVWEQISHQSLNTLVTLNLSQPQEQDRATAAQQVPPHKPELECPICYIDEMELSDRMTLSQGSGFKVALADFHMEPVEDSEPWIEVRSQITFHDIDLTRRWRVRNGVWLHSDKVSPAFHRGETRSLILALLSTKGIVAYEHRWNEPGRNPKNTYLRPSLKPLNEDRFFIEVRLIGEYLNQLRLDRRFWYEISRSPEWEIRQVSDDELRN